MISIPTAVYNQGSFHLQLDLFWYNHKRCYGDVANHKAMAAVIKRNHTTQPKQETYEWDIDVPYLLCEGCYDYMNEDNNQEFYLVPLNIQIGLAQLIDRFSSDQVIEILDCDMFHMRPHPEIPLEPNELLVSDIYENWHLKSLTDYKHVVEPHLKPGHTGYNGGFVPIIGHAATFKRILPDWISIHKAMVLEHPEVHLKWWSGMYSLQAACANNHVKMTSRDYCYVPGVNEINDNHYISHYCCDSRFDKKKVYRWQDADPAAFADNMFYHRIHDWIGTKNS